MIVTHNWTSPNPEWWIEYNARQSAPKNRKRMEEGELSPGALIKKCLEEEHWSPFEHAFMSIEVTTSMPICVQMLRHRSFSFQQFSARFANPLDAGLDFEPIELRYQSKDSRQGSTDDPLPADLDEDLQSSIRLLQEHSEAIYRRLITAGMAREISRNVLLQGIQTRFTVSGPAKSYITYLRTRLKKGTQKEHRIVAMAIRDLFAREFPLCGESCGWKEPEIA